MKKIKWRNVVKLIVLGVASCYTIYVSFMLMFYTLLTGNSCMLTWAGVIGFVISCMLIADITDDFKYQLKKTSKVRRQYK